jgi:hypothetical protein
MWCQVESQTGKGQGRKRILATLSGLVTANVAAVMLLLVGDSPTAPHATTTSDGFASVNEDASHFTQEETVKAEEPVGRVDNKEFDTYDPLATTRAALGKEVELE